MADVPRLSDATLNEKKIKIGHIPLDDSVSSSVSTFATGTIQTITWTTTPADSFLSLWNYHFTIRVDVDDNDHVWPNGSALTAAQSSLRVANYIDWYLTDDNRNKLVVKIHIENYSGSNRTVYLKYKTYTFAYTTASTA
jgi:hypothetical protein